MKTRDVWNIACKLLAILIARQAVYPLAQLAGMTGPPSRLIVRWVVEAAAYLAIAALLWFRSDSLVSFAAAEGGEGSNLSVTARQAIGIGLALIGIWLLAHGIVSAIINVADLKLNPFSAFNSSGPLFTVARPPIGSVNPIRSQAEWAIIAYVIEALIGAALILFRRPFTERIVR